MSEKEAIEKATAEAFIELYNRKMGTAFSIVEYSDAPDIRCKDLTGRILNLEITLTDDGPKDIQAALGRSDHRSFEALKKHHLSRSPFDKGIWIISFSKDRIFQVV